jgi:hypothetical protein
VVAFAGKAGQGGLHNLLASFFGPVGPGCGWCVHRFSRFASLSV